ncbi:hypothetical protein MRB53_038769 [Persea americana]|nr:hypothetical protein MRB53_038769 [Persea americana]
MPSLAHQPRKTLGQAPSQQHSQPANTTLRRPSPDHPLLFLLRLLLLLIINIHNTHPRLVPPRHAHRNRRRPAPSEYGTPTARRPKTPSNSDCPRPPRRRHHHRLRLRRLQPRGLRAHRQHPTATSLPNTECVAWNPTREAELASFSADGTLRLWDVRSRAPLVSTVVMPNDAQALAWHPSGESLIVGLKNDLLVVVDRVAGAGTAVSGVSTTADMPPSSSTAVACRYRSTIRDVDGQERESNNPIRQTHSTCLAISPTGRHIATGGTDAIVTLWETENWTCSATFAGLAGAVRSLSFSFDGAYIVAGSEEGGTFAGGLNGEIGPGGAREESGGVGVVCWSEASMPANMWPVCPLALKGMRARRRSRGIRIGIGLLLVSRAAG